MKNKEPVKITPSQRFKMRKFIKKLDQYRGRHTEFVSVYIPKDYDLNKIINHLQQEQGTAQNIKSKTNRDSVISSLERLIQHLKLFKRTPNNGLVAFSGNVAERDNKNDFQVWSIEPPVPINQRLYRCDKTFVLEPLRQIIETEDIYGLVVIDRREGNIAYLKGKTIIPVISKTSNVPGKFKAGGQSAARFARNRELAAKEFYKKIADYMKDEFLGKKHLKGILLGGPGPTKEEFMGYIHTELKNKIIAVKDLGYTGDFGLKELLEKSEDVLSDHEIVLEEKLVRKFFDTLSKDSDMVAYGIDEAMEKLKFGAVDILLLSETLDDDVIEDFEEEAKKVNTKTEIISNETESGQQLTKMGKVGAILRYKMKDY